MRGRSTNDAPARSGRLSEAPQEVAPKLFPLLLASPVTIKPHGGRLPTRARCGGRWRTHRYQALDLPCQGSAPSLLKRLANSQPELGRVPIRFGAEVNPRLVDPLNARLGSLAHFRIRLILVGFHGDKDEFPPYTWDKRLLHIQLQLYKIASHSIGLFQQRFSWPAARYERRGSSPVLRGVGAADGLKVPDLPSRAVMRRPSWAVSSATA